ncbi:uncharacterized protein mgab [Pholidichthys leucotaenia]
MSASDLENASTEPSHEAEDKEGGLLNIPSSAPPTSILSLMPPFLTTAGHNFTSETVMESKAVSVASNDCNTGASSPAEASPAKPAVTSTSTFEATVEPSPDTSCITSAVNSLKSTDNGLISMSESMSYLSEFHSKSFGSSDVENDCPSALTFKDICVTLENNNIWKQFHSCGTEMILAKHGRRMFPYCRYRLTGLDPNLRYSLVLSIVPSNQYKYHWCTSRWEVSGQAENNGQGPIRAFSHHYSPCRGSDWMSTLVSFYRLKLTNNSKDQDGHVLLHSMHRYIPRLHVIPVLDDGLLSSNNPVVVGPECMTFTFPQTEFMAVTTYQNFRITQLKIKHNPFARGFQDDDSLSHLIKTTRELQSGVQPVASKPDALQPPKTSEIQEEAMDLSMQDQVVPSSVTSVQESKLVLKPIMSNLSAKDAQFIPCIRGNHALGQIVVTERGPSVEDKEKEKSVDATSKSLYCLQIWTEPKATPECSMSSLPTRGSLPMFHKKRKGLNRRWGNGHGKMDKFLNASPTVLLNPTLTVAMQPELDEIDGLLFISFSSKEALEVYVRHQSVSTPPSPPQTSHTPLLQLKQTMDDASPETDDNITRLESVLLNELRLYRYRQVIHPVLQAVGLKLGSLDPTMSIDLRYLGVCLPLPPPNLPSQSKPSMVSSGRGLPFISRTGKTSDMTKIKGWKNKFLRTEKTSSHSEEGLQKNISAFCSNMLDKYLESEAQQISERADAFFTDPQDPVSYQLPAKSSSYVKTLDSALKNKNYTHINHFHCRKPECMLGCDCFKRKITKLMTTANSEQYSVSSVNNGEHIVHPHLGSRAYKLWNTNVNDEDPEAVFTPKRAPLCVTQPKVQKRPCVPRPTQPIREEDKDPVYKFFESLMTCARVREFNRKPPPEVKIEPKIFAQVTATNVTSQQKINSEPKKTPNMILTVEKTAEKSSQETESAESKIKRQIQIESACNWENDHKMILGALCQHITKDQPSECFTIGSYCISPISRIMIQKQNGSELIYKVLISKASKGSDQDDNKFDSKEEKPSSKSSCQPSDAKEEDGEVKESKMWLGVTPFLSRVIPAGVLIAQTKTTSSQEEGLIKVNDKSYNKAKLFLGSLGSLHPANRLAAYITGRLHTPAQLPQKDKTADPKQKASTSRNPSVKGTNTFVPPVITERKPTDQKILRQPAVQFKKPTPQRNWPIVLQQKQQQLSSNNPASLLSHILNQNSSANPFLSSSTSSPILLSVSPSLKSPRFLEDSRTRSFRICPPSIQGANNPEQSGVALSGGYTFVQLPKPGADRAPQQPQHVNASHTAGLIDALLKKDGMCSFSNLVAECLGKNTCNEVRSPIIGTSVQPGCSPQLVCEKKMQSDESEEAQSRQEVKQEESKMDVSSEGSNSSDYSEEEEEDDEMVDIETVDEAKQRMAVVQMKKAANQSLSKSRDCSDDVGSVMDFDNQDQGENGMEHTKKRENHIILERLRRTEQRILFSKLKLVLGSHSNISRLRLLVLAVQEIKTLVQNSKILEERKLMLLHQQSDYVHTLSRLTGKPEDLIRHKVKEINKKQKRREQMMKSNHFFSQILQSRAAHLQAEPSQSKPEPPLQPLHEFHFLPQPQPEFMAPPQATLPTNSLMDLPNDSGLSSQQRLLSLLQPLPSYAPTKDGVSTAAEPEAAVEEADPPSNSDDNQKACGEPDQVTMPNSGGGPDPQAVQVTAAAEVTAAQDGESASSSTPNPTAVQRCPSKPIHLPLIRSKTGRIILPSSLRPARQGFYTLMVVNPNQKGKNGNSCSSANIQLSDVDASKNSENKLAASDQSSVSDPDSKIMTFKALSELALMNRSLIVPLDATEPSQKGAPSVGSNNCMSAVHLNFKLVHHNSSLAKPGHDPSTTMKQHGRGRALKDSDPPFSPNKKRNVVVKSKECHRDIKTLVQNDLEKPEDNPGEAEQATDTPLPVKRSRGRPRKDLKTAAQAGMSPVKRIVTSLSTQNHNPNAELEKSPIRTTPNTSRPLTRGSLGKDFPSEKKRSWIDIEKELETELE